MLNENGVLATLDRGITINWDDGPTLHKITAQVRYHTDESATARLLRVHATQPYSDEPLTFKQTDATLQAIWVWQTRGAGWSVQLVITNTSDEDVYVDTLEVMRIDSAYGGVFNLGAPPGLWRCAKEDEAERNGALNSALFSALTSALTWEAWAETTASAGGFTRARMLMVQPTVSNRSRPPAVLIAVNNSTAQSPVEMRLECSGERFVRLTAGSRTDGTLVGAGAMLASAELWIASGDDAEELRQWARQAISEDAA